MSLRIVVTGGTFDKYYDKVLGELTFSETHLPEILEQVHLNLSVTVEVNQLVDSLHMDDGHRAMILDACRAAPEGQIVVIHGTDTMNLTAELLGQADLGKCIVLTGAMVPYSVTGSDALFNLGFAVAAAQLLAPGVYVAMNGRCFPWNDVRKDRAGAVFRSLAE